MLFAVVVAHFHSQTHGTVQRRASQRMTFVYIYPMRNYPIGKLAGLETREKASLAGRDTRANDTTLLAGAHDTSVAG